MKKEELHTIMNPNGRFAVRYFAVKYSNLPIIRTYYSKLDTEQLCSALSNKYKNEECKIIHNKEFGSEKGKNKWTNVECNVLADIKLGLILQYEYYATTICYDESISESEIKELEKLILKCKDSEHQKNRFWLVKNNVMGEYDLADFKIKPINVKLDENYNEDLAVLHPKIIEFLNSPDDNGIVLLHGEPGTGKTSYIRHLITECKSKFIFLPNNLFGNIGNPDFIAFISSHPNTVIILEDCEELLKPRGQNNSETSISNLLNLGDGLLGDALKLKIICTFNSSLTKLDEALLRKGRLKFTYEFKPLADVKVKQLLKSLNIEVSESEPMVLADIFNYTQKPTSIDNKKVIGFNGN